MSSMRLRWGRGLCWDVTLGRNAVLGKVNSVGRSKSESGNQKRELLLWLEKESVRYLVAVASVAFATLVRMSIDPLVGDLHPFVTYFFSIIFTAWFCGLGPSVLVLILGFFSAAYFFASPRWSILVKGVDVQVGMVLYVFIGISCIVFSELTKAANKRAIQTANQLIVERANLEREMELRLEADRKRDALLRRIVDLQEEERRRLARELHDQCGQDIIALQLSLQIASQHVEANRTSESKRSLLALRDSFETLSRAVHSIAFELRPPILDDLGLSTACQSLLNTWAERTGVRIDFECRNWERERVPADVSLALYRVIQEALNNIAKHANCSRVGVVLEIHDSTAIVIVEDNGVGMNLEEYQKDSHDYRYRLGIRGMEERLASVGGKFYIESESGIGTTILGRVPLQD